MIARLLSGEREVLAVHGSPVQSKETIGRVTRTRGFKYEQATVRVSTDGVSVDLQSGAQLFWGLIRLSKMPSAVEIRKEELKEKGNGLLESNQRIPWSELITRVHVSEHVTF